MLRKLKTKTTLQSAKALMLSTLKVKTKKAKKTHTLGLTLKTVWSLLKISQNNWALKTLATRNSTKKISKNILKKLDKLDKEAKEKFNNIPAEKKLIVTSEACFKYFSKAYGVPSAYIWEINTEEEGTPDQIKTLVEKLRQTKTPSLFVESSVDDRPMKTVSQDTNIPIYAQIFTDSIAEQGKEGDSYYNMMKYNLDKIAEGLAK